ncbi:CvpA family protein [Candidatus Palibaumannia cicadellinicola]|uniref:CvpA family protein n=1 Tax=Baumannia cicadellinicola subsp. Homalodisca coagulata TaxID=374463 RepID=Q1LTA3_BAUCH|nr:CvpA family protein [Candidatus Baumannia cicadellinicola]ABF14198.1 CvpA family protein [Baumannia cicadellinicola str. Hc (Homalodisca coagulata)]MCJ7462207.1 CvpA family protein [Candidatus Baumannia cicadellinicola]MCJ7462725.1 CvpA family protein [Candidatus Baumannia cicadellinicola]
MSRIDYLIISIIMFSTLLSLIRGFIQESLSLINLACAFFVSSSYYQTIANYLTQFEEEIVRNSLAITILFIITMLIGKIINNVASSLVERAGLDGTDRVLGACFGLLRGILIILVILYLFATFTNCQYSKYWQQSLLIPQLCSIMRWLLNYLHITNSNMLI